MPTKKMMEIVIPVRAYSWNKLLNNHHRVRMRERDALYGLVFKALNDSGQRNKDFKWKYPLTLEVHAQMTRQILDVNNICDKFIVDALIKYKVIIDDTPKYIEKCIYTCTKYTEDLITIRLYETAGEKRS